MVHNILFVIAMESEALPLLTRLSLIPVDNILPNSPCKIYSGTHNGAKVSVVINGKCPRFNVDFVGTVPASLATFLAINQIKPELVINAGTAGGFRRKGAAIGDAFISTVIKNHDRRIPIPGFTEYGIGSYESIDCSNLIKALKLQRGIVTTSNALDHSDIDDKLMLENDASVKDMEAASVAWTCGLSNTPFFCVKVITDVVDGDRPTHEEFLENLHAAANSLEKIVPLILDFVIGKKLSEL